MLTDQLARVRHRIQEACQRSGRAASAVTLIGVTKTLPLEMMLSAVAAGLRDVGENRVQEAQQKFPHLPVGVRRHMIGHVQRNKAKHAVDLFDVIHSVDTVELALTLERHAAMQAQGSRLKAQSTTLTPIEIFIQVNVSGEATKFGCPPDMAMPLAKEISRLPHLALRGLMTIAPLGRDPQEARPHFRRLRQLREAMASTFHRPSSTFHLSMGMSNDFEIAIEEGADLVRIGTAIFGTRDMGQGTRNP